MDTDDAELLTLAARACGLPVRWDEWSKGFIRRSDSGAGVDSWNPLENDNDALRLAGRLHLRISASEEQGYAEVALYRSQYSFGVVETYKGDPSASIRRAIVRAAAEIGKRN